MSVNQIVTGINFTLLLVHGQVTIIFVESVCLSVCLFVCLSVCLCRVFSAVFDPISFKLRHMLYVCVELCPLEYRGCGPLGAGWPLKTCIFRVFWAQKTISSYGFDRIVLIFGYIVERTDTKILSSHFLQFPSWTQIMTSEMTSFPVLQKLS